MAMKIDEREPSGREKDEASVKLLAQLREKLYSDLISVARRAAFNLAWMQEDGLQILKEALYGKCRQSNKRAAVYGLRKMQGRMKKIARELLEEGLGSERRDTREVCEHGLAILSGKKVYKPAQRKRRPKSNIREISNKSARERQNSDRSRRGISHNRGRG